MSCRLLLLLILLVVLVTDKSNTCTKAHCLALVEIDSRRPRRETETDRQTERINPTEKKGAARVPGWRAGGLEGAGKQAGVQTKQKSKIQKSTEGEEV